MTMLITLFSLKGSPGVTSTALALASVWPRPVTLIEADPSGGDLAFRCRAVGGGPVSSQGGLLALAATVRGGFAGGDVVSPQSQPLAHGVSTVIGASSALQSRGLGNLWGAIAQACFYTPNDVIVDAGRLDAAAPLLPLLRASRVLMPVASASLESVMHLHDGLPEVMRATGDVAVLPLVVGPSGTGARDCADVDALLSRSGLPVSTARAFPWDARTLHRLEAGEDPAGRLRQTLLMRSARALAGVLAPSVPEVVS